MVGGTSGDEFDDEIKGFAYAQDVYGNWLWSASLTGRGRAMSSVE